MSNRSNANTKNEKDLIYLMLHHKHVIEHIMNSSITEKYFSHANALIFKSIVESFDVDDVLLTRKAFKAKLNSYGTPKDRIAQELAFNACAISKSNVNDLPYLIKTIVETYVEQEVAKNIEAFRVNKESKGTLNAIRDLVDGCEDLLSGSTVNETTYFKDIRTLSDEQCQYLEDVISGKIGESKTIKTGIKEIDFTMATGLEDGTLTLFCADVGGFKSAMMLNIGMNVWEQGYDVLFVPLEMHRKQMWRRAMARDARINSRFLTRDIKENLTSEHLEKIRLVKSKWGERQAKFFIMQEPGNTTVEKIEKLIERNVDLIKPKVVVIDYVANLEAHKNRYGRNDLEIGDMLKKMRQMGKDLGFAVVSGAQLGREALKRIRKDGANKDKPTINSEDIRGSHEYSADADNIYAQLRNTSQPNQLLDLYCVKARNGTTTFEDDSVRAVLEVYPQFGLIKSSPADGEAGGIDDIMGDYVDNTEANTSIVSKGSNLFEDDDTLFSEAVDSKPSQSNENVDDVVDSMGEAGHTGEADYF